MPDTTSYGDRYWCIGRPDGNEIYLNADRAEVQPSGALVMVAGGGEEGIVNLALAAGQWVFVYAASVIDGHAVAVQHWKGQIIED